jgi:Gnt-I system high-affinity gluconate transporter
MTLLIIAFAIALQVILTIKKVSPFLSLLIVSIVAAFLLGMKGPMVIASVEKGVGSTLGGLALILCLGAVLGKILEASGAAERIAITLIKKFGQQYIQWAMLLTGFLIGLPLYYNAGFIILVPLVFMLARKTGLPVLYVALPMAAALSTTHCFLPPHPGPVILVNAFQANMGKVLMYGILIAIPAVIVAGPVLARRFRMLPAELPTNLSDSQSSNVLPNAAPSFFIALLPVLLITLSVLADAFLNHNSILFEVIAFTGNTNIALLLSTLAAIYVFGIRKQVPMTTIMKWVGDGVSGIAMIMLIITAGGVFKQVLTDSGTGDYIASFSSKWQMPPLLFAWLVTALLRVTIGSATVAAITAAGVVAPLIAASQVSPELMVLAVGSGSVFGSHINDSGFWMFKEFFHLTLKQTFMSWTVMETTISLIGLVGVLAINYFLQA